MRRPGAWWMGTVAAMAVGCSDTPGLGAAPDQDEAAAPSSDGGGTTTTPGDGSAAVPSDDEGGGDGTAGPDLGIPLGPASRFVDVTLVAGMDIHPGDFAIAPFCILDTVDGPPGQAGDYCLPERFVGAAAVGDVDADGWPDVYVTRFGGPDRLMHNRGNGTFVDIAAQSGLTDAHASSGAAWIDIEGDGDLDLMLTTLGDTRYFLYVNDGSGHFEEQGRERGAAVITDHVHVGMSIAVGDYDRDGYLDLFVTDWRPSDALGGRWDHNRLLHNRGEAAPGYFEDVTDAMGIALAPVAGAVGTSPGVYGFAPAFVDLDGDLWPELALAADFGTSRLYWNEGGQAFSDRTEASGVGTDANGMGSTFGDIDGDGDLDWFVSAIWNPDFPTTGNRMYLNEGDRTFTDFTDALGLRQGGWGWGTAMFDADLDGDLDLALAAGWPSTPFAEDPVRLWLNIGPAQWPDLAPAWGITFNRQGRGLVPLDYDRDGDLDLLVLANVEMPALWRNDSETGSWLQVEATAGPGNPRAIGAHVAVQAQPGGPSQVRVIGVGSHLFGQQDAVAHFGLGDGAGPLHRVEITWPATGARTMLHDVPRGQRIAAQRP